MPGGGPGAQHHVARGSSRAAGRYRVACRSMHHREPFALTSQTAGLLCCAWLGFGVGLHCNKMRCLPSVLRPRPARKTACFSSAFSSFSPHAANNAPAAACMPRILPLRASVPASACIRRSPHVILPVLTRRAAPPPRRPQRARQARAFERAMLFTRALLMDARARTRADPNLFAGTVYRLP